MINSVLGTLNSKITPVRCYDALSSQESYTTIIVYKFGNIVFARFSITGGNLPAQTNTVIATLSKYKPIMSTWVSMVHSGGTTIGHITVSTAGNINAFVELGNGYYEGTAIWITTDF